MKSPFLIVCLMSALLLTACFASQNNSEQTDINPDTDIETDISSTAEDAVDSPEQQETSDTTDTESEQETNLDIPVTPVETIDEYFASAAFVGDSVMHGLELYSRRTQCVTTPSTFLTVTSFSARHALSELTDKSYHPMYNGEKMLVEDALSLCGAKRVFISIGLNDVLSAPTKYFEQYTEFIARIKEKNPDIKVYVFSPTRPVEVPNAGKMDVPTAEHYKEKICELDAHLREYCEGGNANYVDVASPVLSENGFLSVNYTSDSYVHLTNKAYTLWTIILEAYANAEIAGLPAPDSLSVIQSYLDPQPTVPPVPSPPAESMVNESDTASTEQVLPEQNSESQQDIPVTDGVTEDITAEDGALIPAVQEESDASGIADNETNNDIIIENVLTPAAEQTPETQQ